MTEPKVTIAIPTLNRANYLKLAIASSLAQTYTNLEIVISDNVSNDGTPELLASYANEPRIRLLRQAERLDMVGNWNACLAAATGEYFLLLSDDDLLEAEAIEELVGAFTRSVVPAEEIGMAYCGGFVIDENGNELRQAPSCPAQERAVDICREFFKGRRMTWPCCILLRRRDITAGYPRDLALLTDNAQWMQAVARHGYALFVNRPLVRYRMHLNLTAKTPPEVWQKENTALAERSVELLKANGRGSEADLAAICKAAAQQNVRLVSGLINQMFSKNKLKGLLAYLRQRRFFTGAFGLFTVLTGSVELLAPKLMASLIRARRLLIS